MSTVNEFLLNAARSLNDAQPGREFRRWSRELLISFLNEAIDLIRIFRPDEFTSTAVVQLSAGTWQTVDCCSKVLKVFCQTDKYGNEIGGTLLKISPTVISKWIKEACPQPAGSAFRLSSYTIENKSDVSFSVRPPVPVNAEVYVRLSCIKPPSDYDLNDGDVSLDLPSSEAAAMQWVLYRAMIIDDESETAAAVAGQHLSLCLELLKVQYAREKIAQIGDLTSPEVRSELQALRGAGLIGKQV